MSKEKEQNKDTSLETAKTVSPSGFKVVVREFKKDKLATFSLVVLSIILLTVFIGSCFFDVN